MSTVDGQAIQPLHLAALDELARGGSRWPQDAARARAAIAASASSASRRLATRTGGSPTSRRSLRSSSAACPGRRARRRGRARRLRLQPGQRCWSFVNGRFAPDAVAAGGLPAGVTLGSLATALAEQAGHRSTLPRRSSRDSARAGRSPRSTPRFARRRLRLRPRRRRARAADSPALRLDRRSPAPVMSHPRTLIVGRRSAARRRRRDLRRR